jgi:hypothetical protein
MSKAIFRKLVEVEFLNDHIHAILLEKAMECVGDEKRPEQAFSVGDILVTDDKGNGTNLTSLRARVQFIEQPTG